MAATGGMRAARNAGQHRGADGDEHADRDRVHAVRVEHTTSPLRRVEAERADHREEDPGEQHAERETRERRDAPMTPASTTTDTMIWRRLAPIARSSPSSWVRCATRIVNVLKMMKAATTRPMRGEPEQHTGEEVEELGDVLPGVGRDLIAASTTSNVGTERARSDGGAASAGTPGVAGHVDRVEQPRPGHDPLRGREIERGERERPDLAAVAEREQPDDS